MRLGTLRSGSVTETHRERVCIMAVVVVDCFSIALFDCYSISVCRLRERGRMSKSVYVRVFHDLELLRYVLRCEIERQL